MVPKLGRWEFITYKTMGRIKEPGVGSGNTAKSKANLIAFKKGHDERRKGNGRPIELPGLKELLAKTLGQSKNGVTAAEVVLNALLRKAAKGDTRAIELLLDRGYGKVTQGLHVTGKDEAQIIQVEIIKTVRHEQPIQPGDEHTPGKVEGVEEPGISNREL
jgi:hypothetical protein